MTEHLDLIWVVLGVVIVVAIICETITEVMQAKYGKTKDTE